MDRTRKDYIKLDNPNTERQMLHVIFSFEARRPKYWNVSTHPEVTTETRKVKGRTDSIREENSGV